MFRILLKVHKVEPPHTVIVSRVPCVGECFHIGNGEPARVAAVYWLVDLKLAPGGDTAMPVVYLEGTL